MKREHSDQDDYSSSKQLKEGLERGGPGVDYQVQLLMFFAHQGHTLSQNVKDFTFEIGKERKEAGKFDDIIVRYKLEPHQQWKYLFIQAKHTKDIITTGQLLSSNSTGPFTLLKYFTYYIGAKEKFNAHDIESCVIATNTDFQYDTDSLDPLKLKCTRARKGSSGDRGSEFYLVDAKQNDDVNQIFKTDEMKETKYYRLDKRPLLLNELEEEFYESYNALDAKEKKNNTDKDIIRNFKNIIRSGQSFTDEIKEFLDKLLFIVNLPNREDLWSITKQKIGEEMSFLDDSIESINLIE